MPATPLTSPDAPADAWTAHLDAITTYVQEHEGRFPNPHSVDPAEAEVGSWWVRAQDDADSNSQLHDLDALRRRATQLRVDALTEYVLQHEGRFPPNRAADPGVAALGCWWVAQNIELNRQKMAPDLAAKLDQLRALAAEHRAAAKTRHTHLFTEAARRRARAATLAAGRAGAIAAAEALKSPHLIPGDADVLQLRISHPGNTLADLAGMAGLTLGRFSTKYYGALHRGPNSRTPLRKSIPERLFAPGEAADMIGVPRKTLGRWADAGLIAAQRNNQGHRRYLGAEVLRVKSLIVEGWPAEFVEAAGR
jgi:hypothetical protein